MVGRAAGGRSGLRLLSKRKEPLELAISVVHLEPLELAISDVLIPSLTEHNCPVAEQKLLALPARMGGLGMTNPSESV